MEFDLSQLTPDIRHLDDMRNVLHDKEFSKIQSNLELYSMYRGLEEKDGLRYDITIVPAKMLGDEFVKTKGHYHIGAYGELYTVLEGRAIYLMQKIGSTGAIEFEKIGRSGNIDDVYAVEAKKGDVVIIPSFYGHVTINPSETEELKMANWVSKDCKSDYSDYEKLQGACWYFTKSGWVKNENYRNVPGLRFESPINKIPENLDFLKNG